MSPLALMLMLGAIMVAVTTAALGLAWVLFLVGAAVQVAGVASQSRE